ncbi:MAG: tandem-95 repeat protein, partial [Sphingomonadales bacterium]|nr:tandem-95 repeat protein [Sphingomonadales bacterium]
MAEDSQNGGGKDQQQPPKSSDQRADDPNLWVERNPRNPEERVELTEAINAEASDDASLSNLHYGSGAPDRDPIGAGEAGGPQPGDVDPVPDREGAIPSRPAEPGPETTPVGLSDPLSATPAPPLGDTDPPAAVARGGGRSITGRVGADFVPGAGDAPEPAGDFVGAPAGLTAPPAETADADPDTALPAGTGDVEITLAALPVSVAEDEAVPLLILVDSTGDASALVVRIDGVPAGARLSAGEPVGDGVWQLSPDQLPGLEMTMPAHFSGELALAVDVLGPDAGDGGPETLAGTSLDVAIAAVADKPLLDYRAEETGEGTLALEIDAALVDTDGSESLALFLDRLPEGAVVSDGGREAVFGADGALPLEGWELDALTIAPPAGVTELEFEIRAEATEQAGGPSAVTLAAVEAEVPPRQPVVSIAAADRSAANAAIEGDSGRTAVDYVISLDQPAGQDIYVQYRTVDGSAKGVWSEEPGADLLIARAGGPGDFYAVTGWVMIPAGETEAVITAYVAGDNRTEENEAFRAELLDARAAPDEDGERFGIIDVDHAMVVTTIMDDDRAAAPDLNAADATGAEDTAIPLDISASVTDAGDALSLISVGGLPEGTVLSDGANSFTASVDATAVDITGWDLKALTITPPPDANGTFELSITAQAQDGSDVAMSEESIAVTVTGTNDGPVANAGTDTATEDGGAVAGTLSSSDVDGDDLTFSLVTPPAEGSVTVNADGTYSFDPGSDFQDLGVGETRDVSFTYEVDDGEGGTAQASVTVTVTGTNDGPVADAGTDTATEDGGAVAGTLSSSDVDGDSLTYSLVTPPAEGSVTVNADGTYSFDPGADFQDLGVGETRDVSFTYEVDDGEGGTAQASVTVTVTGTNDGPVADAGTDTATEDG